MIYVNPELLVCRFQVEGSAAKAFVAWFENLWVQQNCNACHYFVNWIDSELFGHTSRIDSTDRKILKRIFSFCWKGKRLAMKCSKSGCSSAIRCEALPRSRCHLRPQLIDLLPQPAFVRETKHHQVETPGHTTELQGIFGWLKPGIECSGGFSPTCGWGKPSPRCSDLCGEPRSDKICFQSSSCLETGKRESGTSSFLV